MEYTNLDTHEMHALVLECIRTIFLGLDHQPEPAGVSEGDQQILEFRQLLVDRTMHTLEADRWHARKIL